MQSQTSKSKLLRVPSLTVVPPQQSAAKAHSALSSMTPTGSVTSDSDSDSDNNSCFDSWSSTTGDFTSESDSDSESSSSSDDEGSSGSAHGRASNMRSHSLADMGPSGSAAPGGDTGPATPTSGEHTPFSRPESPVYVPGGAGADHFVPGSTRLSTADGDSTPYSAWSSSEDSDSEDGSVRRITARPRASSTIQPDQALQEPLFARYLVQHWEREDDLAAAAAAAASTDAGVPETTDAAATTTAGSRPKIPVMGEAKSPALMLRKDLRRERHNSTNTCLVNNVIPAPIIEDLVHWFVTPLLLNFVSLSSPFLMPLTVYRLRFGTTSSEV